MNDELRAAKERLCEMYAAAYLAEHPADDNTPIDEAWLRRVGFIRHMQSAGSNDLSLGNLIYVGRRNNSRREEAPEPRFYLRDIDLRHIKTRGQLRRLCIALGIELKEKT